MGSRAGHDLADKERVGEGALGESHFHAVSRFRRRPLW